MGFNGGERPRLPEGYVVDMSPAERGAAVFDLAQQYGLDPALGFRISENIARISRVPWLNPAVHTNTFHLRYTIERDLSAAFKTASPNGVELDLMPLNPNPSQRYHDAFRNIFGYYGDRDHLLNLTSEIAPNVHPEDDVNNIERFKEYQRQSWRFFDLNQPMAGRIGRMKEKLKQSELTLAAAVVNQATQPLFRATGGTYDLLRGAVQELRVRNRRGHPELVDAPMRALSVEFSRTIHDFLLNQGRELILAQTGQLDEPPVYEPLLHIFEHGFMPYGLEVPKEPDQKGKLKVMVPTRTRLIS